MTDFPTSLTSPDQHCQTQAITAALEAARTHNRLLDPLIFETLESEPVDNNRHLTNILREYREFGVKTAIDDFGVGCSGLSQSVSSWTLLSSLKALKVPVSVTSCPIVEYF